MADGGTPLGDGAQRQEAPPDAFDRIKRRMALLGMSCGGIASLTAAVLVHRVGLFNPVDARILPLLGTTLLLLTVALWRRPSLLPWIERIAWGLLTAYLLTALAYKTFHYPFGSGPLGARNFWFFLSYLLAFLIWSPRNALFASLAVTLALVILALWTGIATGGRNVSLLASMTQLVAASIVYIFTHFSFAQLRPQYARMRTLAFSDPLTGCANRRRAEELLAHEVTRAKRYGRPLSVILFDLDHFKQVNDQHGHAIGDAVLRAVTHAVRGGLRTLDHLARWGGEEFLIIAPEISQPRALQFGERLRKHISTLRVGGGVQPTASFGVASYRVGDTLDSLLQRADRAMYLAKSLGRNRVEVERPQTAAQAPDDLDETIAARDDQPALEE